MLCRNLGTELLSGGPQDGERAVTSLAQLRARGGRNTGLEHRRIVCGLRARERQIGLTETVKRGRRIRASIIPGVRQRRLEQLKAAQRYVG